MVTTQTALQAPFETISLENRSQNEDLPETRRAGRVFEADPAFTTSPASRRLIISLLVCANMIQVAEPYLKSSRNLANYLLIFSLVHVQLHHYSRRSRSEQRSRA
jgi:hypothetical protein